jgi:O-antigen ligase
MTRQAFHTKAHFYLTILIAFSLPFAILTPLFIALMLLNWLVEGDFKNKFQNIFQNKFALLFIAFYLLHLIGLLYTQNLDSGLFDVQVKLSLIIFPLIVASKKPDQDLLGNTIKAFVIGAIASALIMYFVAGYYFIFYSAHRFFYMEFAIFMHPSYLSMYINFAIAWLLFNVAKKTLPKPLFSLTLDLVVVAFLSFTNVLLSSKLGMITMFLLYFGFLIYFIICRKKYLIGISAILVIVVSIYLVLRFVPEINGRISRAITAVSSSTTNQTDAESTAVRLLVWKAANQVISENPIFGTGTGDAKDELMKEYEKRGMTGALEHKLNSHNEYYQVFLALGLVGFLLLLSNLFFPLFFAIKTSNIVYLLFLLIIIINFFTESMFETQAGVIFYAFFNSLLCFNNKIEKSLTLNH